MTKKILAVLLSVAVMFVFTGCMQSSYDVKIGADGKCSVVLVEKMMSDYADWFIDEEDGAVVETVTENDVEYVIATYDKAFDTIDECKDFLSETLGETYLTATGFRTVVDITSTVGSMSEYMEDSELDEVEFGYALDLKITMPEPIVKTTGTVSEDGYTATFHIAGEETTSDSVIDLMVSTKEETTKPTVSGITSGKTYNSARVITATDNSGINSLKYTIKSTGKSYSFKKALTKTLTKNGEYTVTAKDYYGNTTTKTFTIKDTKKPEVYGVTDTGVYSLKYEGEKTMTFTDNCEVSKVQVNGSTVSKSKWQNGYTVQAAGSYKVVVTDVNGNKTTINFKVVK